MDGWLDACVMLIMLSHWTREQARRVASWYRGSCEFLYEEPVGL